MSHHKGKSINCHYCNGNHSCRNCPIESLVAPHMKKIVGKHMESFVANELECPRCHNMTLQLLGNHSPSLDIVCNHCETNFEVKSKCISANTIPNDLILNHGNYFDYLNRQESGLDFIAIIYGVDRKTKVITIRKVFHIPNEMILEKKDFKIVKKTNSTLSDIIIPNNTVLPNITPKMQYSYDFADSIIDIINTNKQQTSVSI